MFTTAEKDLFQSEAKRDKVESDFIYSTQRQTVVHVVKIKQFS